MKSAATIIREFFKGLLYWQSLADSGGGGSLIYGGDESYRRDGIAVISWREWPARIAGLELETP